MIGWVEILCNTNGMPGKSDLLPEECIGRPWKGAGYGRVIKCACLLVGMLTVLVICGCDESATTYARKIKVVALVNGEPITLTDLQRALDGMKQAERRVLSTGERARGIKRELLEKMIDAKLLLEEAKRKRIVLAPRAVDATIEMIERDYTVGGLTEELLRQGKTMDSFRTETRDSLLIQKLLKREVVDRMAGSREEIEKYFKENQERYVLPEQVRVRQIVTKTEEEATELRKQILRGTDFEVLASKHSLGPEATQGGDLGFFSRGRMPPSIEAACFKLKTTQVSQVVASPYGYHLFKLIERRPERKLSIEKAWDKVERDLIAKKTQEAQEEYIRGLRGRASIKRDLQMLESVQ